MTRRAIHRLLRYPILLLALLFPALLVIAESRAETDESLSTVDGVFLEVKPGKARGYLHEQVPLTVTLLAGQVTLRNIQYPRLTGPGFTLSEFTPPRQSNVTRDGQEFTAYEFSAILVPQRSGTLQLGPAELQCELLAPASGAAAFFGENEPRRVKLRAAPVSLTVLPLPAEGRPTDFSGAVGRFTVTMTAQPSQVQVGDPITVHTTIEGVENISTFVCPRVSGVGVRSYPPRSSLLGRSLACEQVLIPEASNVHEIPAVSISFFDPLAEKYQTASSRAITILVSPPPPQPTTAQAPAPHTRPPHLRRPDSLLSLLIGITVVITCFAFLIVRQRRSADNQSPLPGTAIQEVENYLTQAESALIDANVENFYTNLFRALQLVMAQDSNLPPKSICATIDTSEVPSAAQSADHLLTLCDKVRYGLLLRNREDMETDLSCLKAIIASRNCGPPGHKISS